MQRQVIPDRSEAAEPDRARRPRMHGEAFPWQARAVANPRQAPAAASGYSATPLDRKLGLKAGQSIALLDEPAGYRALLGPLPATTTVATALGAGPYDVVHVFARERAPLEATLAALAASLRPDGALWISWPKRSSGVTTDLTEDVLRELALPRGLVDNKVCAIDATWSALRLVWRRELRPGKRSARR